MTKKSFLTCASAVSLALAPALCWLGYEGWQRATSGIESISPPQVAAWHYDSGWPPHHPKHDEGEIANLYFNITKTTGEQVGFSCIAAFTRNVISQSGLFCSKTRFVPGADEEPQIESLFGIEW